MPFTHKELLTRKEAAEMLGLRPQTLSKWASAGDYTLPFARVGRMARYRRSDVEAYVESRMMRSEPAGAKP